MYAHFTSPLPIAMAKWNLSEGRMPMISWSYEYTSKIAAGDYDSLIRSDARELKGLPGPVLVRWFAEMDNGQSRPYVASPASYIAAWRHIVDIFRSAGANNVYWVWCPGSGDFAPGIAQRYYPGNAYVDWGISTGKPLMIGEYGAVEGSPGQKAAWFRQAATQLRTEFPDIRAVVYFDDQHQNFGQDYNWRVTTSASALDAFREFATQSYFTARAATSAVTDRSGA
jgi:beta-mannanase